eukprot:148714_1
MQGDMQQTVINSAISGVCCIVSVTVFIRYIREMYNTKKDNANPTVEVSPVVSRCSTIALFGYTLFTFISFVLDLISLFWFIDFIPIHYTKMLCQVQTFNIAFFMLGKLAMYFFFMLLVHVSFKGSTFAYSPKLLASVAIVFFLIMCTIGGFYTVFLYHDFQAVNSITSPTDCLHFKASNFTTYAIWTGSTCDAIWSFTCLLLFYVRLQAIVKIMEKQTASARRDVIKITNQNSQTSATKRSDQDTVNTPISRGSAHGTPTPALPPPIAIEHVLSDAGGSTGRSPTGESTIDQPDQDARRPRK